MMLKVLRIVLIGFLLVSMAGTAFVLQGKKLARMKHERPYRDSMMLPRKEFAKLFSFGYNLFYADLLYMRSIQAFGGPWRMFIKETKNISEIFETIAELDPKFLEVYEFGSMAISEDAQLPRRAIEFNNIGVINNPKCYKPAYWNAYISWWTLKDANSAKYWVNRASKATDCPDFVLRITSYIDKETGQYSAAVERWVNSYLSSFQARDDGMIRMAKSQFLDISEKADLLLLHNALAKYRKDNFGRLPDSLQELAQRGYLTDYEYLDIPKLNLILEKFDPLSEMANKEIPGLSEKTRKLIKEIQSSETRAIPKNAVDIIMADVAVRRSGIPPSPFDPVKDWYLLRKDVLGKFVDAGMKKQEMVIRMANAKEKTVEALRYARGLVMQYYKDNKRYPFTIEELLSGDTGAAVDVVSGRWNYNPLTGEVKSPTFPDL